MWGRSRPHRERAPARRAAARAPSRATPAEAQPRRSAACFRRGGSLVVTLGGRLGTAPPPGDLGKMAVESFNTVCVPMAWNTVEAEESYRQGLAMLNTLPESSERDTRELELCSALVSALQRTRGYSAPQTVAAGARVRVLAEKVGNLSQLVRQETRTWGALLTTGDYAGAAAIADHILDLARRQGQDTEHLALAHYVQVQRRFYSGDLIGAEEQFARLDLR